jgi:hypothetical protein
LVAYADGFSYFSPIFATGTGIAVAVALLLGSRLVQLKLSFDFFNFKSSF